MDGGPITLEKRVMPSLFCTAISSSLLRCAWAGRVLVALAVILGGDGLIGSHRAAAGEPDGAAAFRAEVEPILSEFCSGCHSGSAAKANVSFDSFASDR